ncbi:hypothetical protein HIM_08582 [Hirsutella minnesotensis 3608]|uniref:Uncharacterized protein n=1 Tax=Hirsutella minnesotensis 3608 TaxID=1043627 RepID=A0A0F7ZH49_9HYPO|nr:hypothetical protein HIM_08582 [Hirsutella minnesotensis 3608]
MLPPVDDSVLRDNPEFASLYSILSNALLNIDGSTKHDPAAKERAAVQEKLDERRLQTVKNDILAWAIETASPPEPKPHPGSLPARSQQHGRNAKVRESPDPLLDLLFILPPLLEAEAPLSEDSAALILDSPPLSDLHTLLPDLAAMVSSNLHSTVMGLARIAHPTTNPSYLHRHITSLPQDYTDLAGEVKAARQDLTAGRLRALAGLTELLRYHTHSLVHLVRSLEAKHGVIARSLELRAADVSLQAQRTETEAAHAARTVEREIYTPQTVAALRAYASQLRDGKLRISEHVHSLQAELEDYGVDE